MGIFSRNKKKSNEATVDLRGDAVIDLTQTTKAPIWGFPTRCPECGEFGYLDRIDVRLEVMYQHCPSCWARWETHRSATVSAD
jgi:hypothetical protein